MTPDKNQQTIFPYRICFVEDSRVVADPIQIGMETLLGAQVKHFLTTNAALEAMLTQGFNQWQIFVFDNSTGNENMKGIKLAQEVKKNCPEAIVVSLNSSDMKEMLDFGLENLRSLGIEVWYKTHESFLMIAWLADCAKEGKMIARAEWLKNIGESPQYLDAFEPLRRPERSLMMLCKRLLQDMETNLPIDPSLQGILMQRDVKDYLAELTAGRKGIEIR